MKQNLLLVLLIAGTGCLTLNAQPELYGVAPNGGPGGYGTLFKFDATSGTLLIKKAFNYNSDGAYPTGKLLYASNGKLYGTTLQGGPSGYGTIFEHDPDAETFTTKVNFDYGSKGGYSYGHMIQADNDEIFGTSSSGGAYGYGTLWKYEATTNTFTKLKDFDYNITGAYPYNGVMQASNGRLYGLAHQGGPGGYGTLYEFDPLDNSFNVLYAFGNSVYGIYSLGKLLEVDGKLYGVTQQGGANGYGTLFEYDLDGAALTTLLNFNYSSLGGYPYTGLIEDDNILYGTTSGGGAFNYGTLYSYDIGLGQPTNLHSFNYSTDGYPYNPVTRASDGLLYGMTYYASANQGSIFRFEQSSGTYTTLRPLDVSTTGGYPHWTELTDMEAGNPACKPLKILKTSTNVSCNGLLDGAIDISVTGATSTDLSFQWSNGATTEDISNLAAGTYSVKVTVNDMNGCSKRTSMKITQPVVLTASASAKKVSFNGTSDGGVNLNVAGGTNPYSYSWSNGATTEDLVNLPVGIYTVEVTDANGCLQTASAEVTKRLTAETDLYGVTQAGGSVGAGTLIKLDYSAGTLLTKHNFAYDNEGSYPIGKLLYADNGLLYGTTVGGGSQGIGVLFDYDPSTEVYTKRIEFDYYNTGANPYGHPIQLDNGDIIGTCASGGTGGYGTLWKYDISSNSIVKLYDFDNSTGAYPYSGVTAASNGKLYGVTWYNGPGGYGTLYEYDPLTNTFAVKTSFNYSNGAHSIGKLVEVDGKLFGITYVGGSQGYGTIFEYNIATGSLTTRHSFDYSSGAHPYVGLNLADNGLLYGTTLQGGALSYGTLYSFDPLSGGLQVLYSFDYYTDGYSYNPVMQASDGNLYGMLHAAGNHTGAIFSFEISTDTYSVIQTFDPSQGSYPFWTELTEVGDSVSDPCLTDNIAPEVITKNVTVELSASGSVSIATGDIDDGSTDNCTIATYELDVSNFDCSNVGPNTVTLTVIDAKGNSSAATAIVTVIDAIAPVLTGIPSDITLSACTASASWEEPVALDNCAVTVVRTGPAPGSSFENGTATTITYTATDAAGNHASASFVVTRAAMLVSTASATTILCKGDASTVTVTASGGTAPYSGVGNFPVAAGTHTFTVTDADGCSSPVTITINEPAALSATINTNNSFLYYGYPGDQSAVITATPIGGSAPYTVSITMVNGIGADDTRVLLCNVLGGNETWSSGANTSSTVNTCGVKPLSISNGNIGAGGSYSVTVSLMADARFVATVTDANGCSYTISYADGARVDAEDVRCFAGNSGNAKIQICHQTGSSKNPCVAICVSESAVAEHIAHGDYYGSCNAACTAPVANARIAAPDGELDSHSEMAMEAYPNPFKSGVSVAVSNPDHGPVNMQMIDVIGRSVTLKVSAPSEEGVYLLDTDHLQPGLYFLKVDVVEKYTRTIKLRKE